MGSLKKLLVKLTIGILGVWLLIDTANGYLLHNSIRIIGGISLGAVIRILFFPVLILSIRLKHRDLLLLFIPYSLIILSVVQFIVFENEFIENIDRVIKVSFPILIYLFVKNNNHFKQNPNSVWTIVYINAGILLLNLYLSFFGIGYSNYTADQELGGTGFFYAGNEVGGLLLVVYSLLMYRFQKDLRKALIVSLLFFVAGVALATKTAIFGSILILGFYIINYQRISKFKIVSFLILSGVFIYHYVYIYIELAINRWEFFINNYGAVTYLLGGYKRLQEVGNYFSKIQEYPILILTGDGWSGIAEQNFIDLVDAYGIIGVAAFFIWVYWGFRAYRKLKNRSDKIFVTLVIFLIITIATLAGHIMQSAMIAPFIAILVNTDIFIQHEKAISYN